MHNTNFKKSVIRYFSIILLFSSFSIFAQEVQEQDLSEVKEENIYKESAVASFYAEKYHGCITANGEVFDMNAFTAAHKSLPFNTIVKVTNLANDKSVTVRINDRGPFVEGREIDLSKAGAIALDMMETGTTIVKIEIVSMPEEEDRLPPVTVILPEVEKQEVELEPKQETQLKPKPQLKVVEKDIVIEPQKPIITKPTASVYSGHVWRIQLGAYKSEANAYSMVKKLRNAGFSPAYEKSDNIIRVVLSGINDDIRQETEDALKKAGFTDYLIRRER